MNFKNNILKIKNAKIISLFFIHILEVAPIKNLKCYLFTLDIEFRIIGLSENWGKQYNIDLRNISGYKHHHYIISNRRGGGGVSLYVKNCLQYKQRIYLANNVIYSRAYLLNFF